MLKETDLNVLDGEMKAMSHIISNLRHDALLSAKEHLSIDGAKFFKDQLLSCLSDLNSYTVVSIEDRMDELEYENEEKEEALKNGK